MFSPLLHWLLTKMPVEHARRAKVLDVILLLMSCIPLLVIRYCSRRASPAAVLRRKIWQTRQTRGKKRRPVRNSAMAVTVSGLSVVGLNIVVTVITAETVSWPAGPDSLIHSPRSGFMLQAAGRPVS